MPSDPLWEQAEREVPNDIALRRLRYRELDELRRDAEEYERLHGGTEGSANV